MSRVISSMLVLVAVGLSVGCTKLRYRQAADREAAKVIAEKAPRVPNMDPAFTIDQQKRVVLTNYPVLTKTEEFLGESETNAVQAYLLTLDDALSLAIRHSPFFQEQKESVFLQALDLTLARHRYTPLFSAGGNATYETRRIEVEREVERLTGGQIVRETRLVEEQQHTVGGRGGAGVDVLLRTGGRLAVDFTTDFLRFLTGDSRWVTSSRLGATLTQPLLRGRGYRVAMEALTQAERAMLYELRDFTLFRRGFSVDIARQYYQILQSRDQVRNVFMGYQNSKKTVERELAFAAEGVRTQTALGQFQQAELEYETRWVNAIRNYRQNLDNFKIRLGLPTEINLVLDDRELEGLRILHPNIEVADAVKIALESRLDLHNERDQFEDAARRIGIAENNLLADLDLILSADLASENNRPLQFDLERARWAAGVDVNLPLDRKAERNAYRRTLIQYEQAGRQLKLAADRIKLEVVDDWRALDQAKRNYEIADLGVKLSERRVEEQELLTEIGRGTARDLVEAREDLIGARDQRTQALVNHTIARLEFWADMGLLFIKENGRWEERQARGE